MRVCSLLVSLLLGVILLGGCDAASNLAGDWGEHSKSRGDVSAAEEGMSVSDVLLKLGKANEIEEGELIYEGWQEWKYPTGTLLIYRGVVRQVSVRPLTESQLAKLKNKDKKYDLDLKVLEGDKEEGLYSKNTSTSRKEDDIWVIDNQTKKGTNAQSPTSRGFMNTAPDIK